MLLIDRRTVADLLGVREVLRVVEDVFVAHAHGKTIMPPKVYLELPQHDGDFRAMPAYVDGAAGIKWVNVHPRNPTERGLPSVMGIVVYNDAITGQPLAVMDGAQITRWRTAAAAALASCALARPDARTLGLIGCGAQAEPQIVAITSQLRLAEIRLYDPSPERVEALIKRFPELPLRRTGVEEAAGAAVVVTLTPAREPVVRREWVRSGAHINAIGADAPGKQELAVEILNDARVFVDDLEQSVHAGELNVAVARGQYHPERIAGTLGQVLGGLVPGRARDDEITVFDSTGLAIQDIACARLVYEQAKARGLGIEVELG